MGKKGLFRLVSLCLLTLSITIGLLLGSSPKAARAARIITMDQAIKIALSNSPRIKEGRAVVRGAISGRKAARAGLFPQVNGYARYDRLSDPVSVVPIQGLHSPPPLFSRDQYQAGLSFRMPLYEGGRLRGGIHVASTNEGIARTGLAYSRETLIAAVTDTFNSILYLESLLGARKKTLSAIEDARNEAALRLKVGKIAPLDLMEIDTQVASERLDLVSTKESLKRTIQQLCVLLGWAPATEVEVKGDLKKGGKGESNLIHSITGPDGLERIKEFIRKRPDILRARKAIEKAGESLKIARGLSLPSVDLVGDYGRHAGSGLDGEEGRWSAGIHVSLNIFNGGLISARVAKAKARQDAAEEALKGLVLKAESEVYSALSSLREAETRIVLAAKARRTAAEAYRIEALRYREGAGTVTDLLKAQAAWWVAKARYIRAMFDQQQAMTALRLATATIGPAGRNYGEQ